ncbi:hypothetical protein Aduo_019483 [Ancylostoma duodenale]
MWGILLLLSAVFPKIFVYVEGTTAFNCRNSLFSDEWRQYVIDELNAYRRSLAVGEVYDKSKNYLPMAKNMNELKWDCNLEEMAYKGLQTIISSCDIPSGSVTTPYRSMQVRFNKKNCNITSQTKIILYAWWSQIKLVTVNYPSSFNGSPSVPGSEPFIRMANGTITAFACTYDFCNNKPKGIMVCVTDDTTPNPVNLTLYEKASNKQEICSACKDNCTKSLCPQPHSPVTLPTTCPDDKLTQDSNNAALWMHNYYRKLLASGWAKDKKSKSGYALPAKQMLALEYDCAKGTENGAKKTYELIKDCPSTTPPPTSGYSLNFLSLSNITVSEQDALEHAIRSWWGDLEKNGLGSDTMFNENSGITNFAHMAYEKVSKVACAVKNCSASGKTLVACQYNSVINAGDKIYEPGKVCSGCEGLNKKCSNPAGLCE